MEPLSLVPHPLASGSQRACYLPLAQGLGGHPVASSPRSRMCRRKSKRGGSTTFSAL
jgi:hypothetical protein